jgi:hypothetical protein
MRWIQRFSPVAAVAALAACQSTGPGGGPDALVTIDAAVVAAEAAAQDVETMRGPGGPMGFGLRADPGSFTCEPAGREGITITRTCTFRDAAGNVQPAYDPVTTASVNVQTTVRGEVTRERWSATMDRTTNLTVSGLAGQETSMTWNGTGSGSSTRVRQGEGGETRQYAMTHSGTVTNVVIPVPRTETSWPLSGSISRTVTVTFTGGPRDGETVQRTVTVTFNGTQFATLSVNGETMQFDLATRGRPKPGERRP